LNVLSKEIRAEVTKNGVNNNNNLQSASQTESFLESSKSLEVTSRWQGAVRKTIGSNYIAGNYKVYNNEEEFSQEWVIDDIE
jgi:hypothetical protein